MFLNKMINMEKNQQQQHQKNKKKIWSNLPDELLLNILLQLPVNSVSRVKCTSKFWYNLITDPYFAKLHLNRSIVDDEDELSLLIQTSSQGFYSIEPNSSTSSIESFVEVEHDQSKLPVNASKAKLLGSCRGLFLMSKKDDSCLWLSNPSTGDSIKLHSPTGISTCNQYIYGIGCDSNNMDDYKVIQIRHNRHEAYDVSLISHVKIEVMIYSLQEDSWRVIEISNVDEIISFLCYDHLDLFIPIYVSGCVHWLGCFFTNNIQRWGIMSFDFGIEEFEVMPAPDAEEHGFVDRYWARMGVLKGCLSMVYYYYHSSPSVEIFLMKEHGVGQSWCKLHSISDSVVKRVRNHHSWVFLCYSKDGKLLVQVLYKELYLYDPETGTLKRLKLRRLHRQILHNNRFSVATYIPSLVPLRSS